MREQCVTESLDNAIGEYQIAGQLLEQNYKEQDTKTVIDIKI